MSADNHLVSVVIPVFNGEQFLAAAVDSVRQQLGTAFETEIIVVDDGSTDGTAKAVSALGGDISYFFQSNQGPSAARNTGISRAKGEIIAFLDVDDLWPKERLSLMLSCMQKDHALDIVMGRVRFTGHLNEDDLKIKFDDPGNIAVIPHLGSGIYRKKVFNKVGFFDESLSHYEDYEWFMRVREIGISILVIKHVTYIYQKRCDSLSREAIPQAKYFMNILKMSLDRRRHKHKDGDLPVVPRLSDFDEGKQK